MASKKDLQLQDYIEEATRNIQEDRAVGSKLLLDLVDQMNKGTSIDLHRSYGEVAAKYLESLQRSNEQLVKIATLLQRQQDDKEGMSKREREAIFDVINNNKDD